MLRYFDFKCTEGHIFEKLIRDEDKGDDYICPDCGAVSKVTISPVRIKADGTDPNNTRAWLKWEKDRIKQTKHEMKKLDIDS